MAGFRVTRRRIATTVALVACLGAALFAAYAHVRPAHAAVVCANYLEQDNITSPPGYQYNPVTDQQHPSPSTPEIWQVYYNLRVDASGSGDLCGMQIVLRITPPPGGKFWGPVRYYANCVSAGCFNEQPIQGSDTTQTVYAAYPNHVVTRSNWFTVTSGMEIQIFSVNVSYDSVEAVEDFIVGCGGGVCETA